MSGLVPPPHTRPGSCTLPWRWEAVEGTADFGGVGMGWGGWEEKTKCVRGEEESFKNCGLATPSPKRGHGPLPLWVSIRVSPTWPWRRPPAFSYRATPLPPPDLGLAATPPLLTLADPLPQPPRALMGWPVALKAKLARSPGACGCPQPPGPARAPPPQAPREGAGTLRRGGMNQTLRG